MHCIVFLLELQKMNGSNEKVYNFTLFKKIFVTLKNPDIF